MQEEIAAYDEAIMTGMQKIILCLARHRLGEPSSDEEETLKTIWDEERLQRMSLAVLNVDSWDKLLQIT